MTFLIEMTLQVTLTAMMILGIKFFFGHKMSSKQHLYIWLILGVRILFPVMPDQPLSIYNHLNLEPIWTATQALEQGGDTQIETQTMETSAEISIPKGDMDTKNGVTTIGVEAFEEKKEAWIKPVGVVLDRVWKIGILVLNFYFIGIYLILRRKVSHAPIIASSTALMMMDSLGKKIGIKQKIKLIDYGEMPMMIGFTKPIILMNKQHIEEEILTHELVHFKHHDMWWNALACFMLSIQWYNPLVWYCFFRVKTDIEIRCDESSLSLLDDKKSYAMMLIDQASNYLRMNQAPKISMTTLGGGKKELKMRIQFLRNIGSNKKIYKGLGLLAIVIVALLSFGNMRDKTADDQDMIAQNSVLFAEEIQQLEIGSISNLKDITPFEWERLVCIPPYADAEYAQNKYGITYDIKETYDESMLNWVFLNNDEVVAYIYGYPSITGIYSRFEGELSSEESLYFIRQRDDYNGVRICEVNDFYGYSDDYKTHLEVYPYKSEYIGDSGNISQLVNQLLYGEFVEGISLETQEQPYTLNVNYRFMGEINTSIDEELTQNAMMIFALIENVERINFTFDLKAPNELENKTSITSYERQTLDEKAGEPLAIIGENEDAFNTFFGIGK